MDFLKTITGKIVTGLVALAVIAGGILFWSMDPVARDRLLSNTGRIIEWTGIVLVVPWATFALIGRVGRLESNAAGGMLVFAYTLVEAVVLAWLFHWKIAGSAQWTFLVLGGLLAGVYNLLTCDWIAEKLE